MDDRLELLRFLSAFLDIFVQFFQRQRQLRHRRWRHMLAGYGLEILHHAGKLIGRDRVILDTQSDFLEDKLPEVGLGIGKRRLPIFRQTIMDTIDICHRQRVGRAQRFGRGLREINAQIPKQHFAVAHRITRILKIGVERFTHAPDRVLVSRL